MVSGYINSHLIGPASLKYIISGTLQEDRELDLQIVKQILLSPNIQLRGGGENQSILSQYLNLSYAKCEGLPKIINVQSSWSPAGVGRVTLP